MNVGIVGIGFMGMVHYLSYAKTRGAKVVAIAELDKERRAGDWRSIQGNFGPRGRRMDLSAIATYAELGDLIADPQVELVDICLPPSLHAKVAIAALRAGKDVFCEKPIALTARDATRMVEESHECERMLMVGQVLPFFPEYAYIRKLIASGRYGALLGGHFKRVICEPKWLPHFFDAQQVGGPMLDLHVHDAHLIRYLFGMPKSVYASGRMRGEVVEYFTSQMSFHDPHLSVSATSGIIPQQGRPFLHGFEIHLEKATLVFESGVVDGQSNTFVPLTILGPRGRVVQPDVGGGDPLDAFSAEIAEVVRCGRRGAVSPLLDGALARDALLICRRQTQSVKSGKLVRI